MIINTLGLWFIYRIVMLLKRHEKRLRAKGGWRLILAYLFVTIAYILDVFYNVICGTIIFLDLPRELTFTARLKRYRKKGQYRWIWQFRLANWFCDELLNPYDRGHC